jgi:hypothetical protein
MYLLYLDDAGSVQAADQRHFVLAGICVFERQVHFLTKELDALAARIFPPAPYELEFHGSHMLPGKGVWRQFRDREQRRTFVRHALATSRSLKGNWALFGVVVDKAEVSPEDPIEFAFEQLCVRFDAFLKRKFRSGDKQRGLIVLDKSTRETRLQSLAIEFARSGHRYGILHSLADVPMFVDSAATRMVQYADLVAYALWQKFERGDDEFLRVIEDAFDREGGVVHGLLHKKTPGLLCDCPYCMTRQRLL